MCIKVKGWRKVNNCNYFSLILNHSEIRFLLKINLNFYVNFYNEMQIITLNCHPELISGSWQRWILNLTDPASSAGWRFGCRMTICNKKICFLADLKIIILSWTYFTATRRGITPNCPWIIFAFATAIDLLFLAPLNKKRTESDIFEPGTLLVIFIILLSCLSCLCFATN